VAQGWRYVHEQSSFPVLPSEYAASVCEPCVKVRVCTCVCVSITEMAIVATAVGSPSCCRAFLAYGGRKRQGGGCVEYLLVGKVGKATYVCIQQAFLGFTIKPTSSCECPVATSRWPCVKVCAATVVDGRVIVVS